VKGKEIWESWKRAWDLWNGHYIEGRIDPGWIREEYEKIKEELETARRRKAAGGTHSGGPHQEPSDFNDNGNGSGHGHNHANSNGNGNNQKNAGGNTTATNPDNGAEIDLMDAGTDDADNIPANLNTSFTRPVDRGVPLVPTLRSAAAVAKCDGSTGGFKPMKVLPDYAAPHPDENENYPEWEDVIANTVWRPRRVGEKTVVVGMDGDWGETSEFEFDGGVDCGRSPYPVRLTCLSSPVNQFPFLMEKRD
jgi:hypothetical protein